jgi:hypothetical protein
MTSWGYALLAAFVALGLIDRVTWRTAGKLAVGLSAIVMLYALVGYGLR